MPCIHNRINISFPIKPNPSAKNPLSTWELNRTRGKEDLVIKKIAIVTIGLMNLAVIGVALYLVVAHCSIPAQVLLVSPFVVGVLSVVSAFQKQRRNNQTITQDYSFFGDPLEALGVITGYLVFGPMKYTMSHLDMTPYHDPYRAVQIQKDLQTNNFKEISLQYGQHFKNLSQYGFIKGAETLENMHEKQTKINYSLSRWAEGEEPLKEQQDIEDFWQVIKDKLILSIPKPPPVDTSRRAQFFYKVSQLFAFENAPVQSSTSQAAAS